MTLDTVRAVLDARAAEVGHSTFLIDVNDDREYSYTEVQRTAAKIAHYIHERGVERGQSVAFAMSNSSFCASLLLGILYGGYRATAVNLVAGKQTIAYVLEHSEARLIFTDAEHKSLIDDAQQSVDGRIPTVVANGEFQLAINQVDPSNDTAAESITADSDGLLMYTSGTTGRPKGVLLSHANLVAGGANTAIAHQLKQDDRALCVLPLYHINGLCVTLMGPLVSAGSVVLPGRFSVSGFWSWMSHYRCSWFSVVPTQISYLLHAEETHDEKNAVKNQFLRFGRSASAPLSPEVQHKFEQRFGMPIIETMGLTETSAQILSNPMPPGVRKIGSPGIAFGGEVRIVDNLFKTVSAGVEGEILVRGANVMKGYLKDPEASSQALVNDGWLRTGDLGRKDHDGYIFVTGRLKELIIKGGENIAPREIDEALYRHPAVIEAAAFACPCENYGQRVEAAVSIVANEPVNEKALLAFCQEQLGKFKMPDRIHFLEELPKGPSGKIQRRRLVEMLVSH